MISELIPDGSIASRTAVTHTHKHTHQTYTVNVSGAISQQVKVVDDLLIFLLNTLQCQKGSGDVEFRPPHYQDCRSSALTSVLLTNTKIHKAQSS